MSQAFPISRSSRQTAELILTAGQTSVPFGFPVFDAQDLDVRIKRPTQTAFGAPLVYGVDYTVSNVGNIVGGTITLLVSPVVEANTRCKIKGKRIHERLTSITQDGRVMPVVMEKELDVQSAVLQELRRDVDASDAAVIAAEAAANAAASSAGSAASSATASQNSATSSANSATAAQNSAVAAAGSASAASASASNAAASAASLLNVAVLKDGSVAMTGDLRLGDGTTNKKIINLATPTNALDATNKTYVDTAIAGISFTPTTNAITHATGYTGGFAAASLENYLRAFEYVNGVADFGIVPNSVSDQTALIQSALNAAAAAGKSLYLPSGDYRINGTGLVSSVPLIGAFGGSTRLIKTAASANMLLRFTAPWIGCENIIFRCEVLDTASEFGAVGWWKSDAAIDHIVGGYYRNCRIQGRFYCGVVIRNTSLIFIDVLHTAEIQNRPLYLYAPTATAVVAHIFIGKIFIDGKYAGAAYTAYGINLNAAGVGSIYHVIIDAVIHMDSTSQGVAVGSNCRDVIINNYIVKNLQGASAGALVVQHTTGTRPRNIIIKSVISDNNIFTVHNIGGENVIVQGMIVKGGFAPIYLNGNANGFVMGGFILGNEGGSANNTMWMLGTAAGDVQRVNVGNGVIANSAGFAVAVNNADRLKLDSIVRVGNAFDVSLAGTNIDDQKGT